MDEVSYKITFVNTSDGSIQTKGIVWGDSGTVQPPSDWSRANYSLMGWDTNNAGTNVVYAKGQNITLSSDITVYTVWEPVYTITYNGNGADAGAMTNVKHTNVFEGDVFDSSLLTILELITVLRVGHLMLTHNLVEHLESMVLMKLLLLQRQLTLDRLKPRRFMLYGYQLKQEYICRLGMDVAASLAVP